MQRKLMLLFALLAGLSMMGLRAAEDGAAAAPEKFKMTEEQVGVVCEQVNGAAAQAVDGVCQAVENPQAKEFLAPLFDAAKEGLKSSLDEAKGKVLAEPSQEEENPMAGTFWALVPPFMAILLALITKEVYFSLFIGLLLGAMFNARFAFLGTADFLVNKGLIEAVSSNAGIFLFLVLLGVMVALLNRTGAALAFGKWAAQHIHTRIGAILATFVLGVLIFIDDYFNCLTVGSVMLPVTDAKKVSRAKLSYIIDATAAPICMIAPISSWAAAVSSYAEGTQFSGLELFCRAIPYNFYSLLTFVFIIGITMMRFDFGPMAKHEINAIRTGDLFTEGEEAEAGIEPVKNAKGTITDMILPVIFLIVICVFAIVYNGGLLNNDGTGFIDAFSNTDATVALPWGGVLAVVLTMLYLRFMRRVLDFKDIMECVPKGFLAMVPAISILTLATALKNMTGALEAREYIAGIVSGSAASLQQFLPAVIFFIACMLAFATGTSWGTFGILIPIVVAIFPATIVDGLGQTVNNPLLFIGMSACLAGAVCGDHCSPISDTTIMSSAGARCQHINHVSTQLPYAASVALISFIGFILAGIIRNWCITFPIVVVLMLVFLYIMKAIAGKKGAWPEVEEAE